MKHLVFKIVLVALALSLNNAYALNCGDRIASDITFEKDLECTNGYAALEVVNNNVTIDLNGFTLSGPTQLAGIQVVGYNKVTIQNGSVRGFWAGVNSSSSDRLSVNNVLFYQVGHGVAIHGGNEARVQDNQFIQTSSVSVSITVRDKSRTASQNLISGNEFYQTLGGVAICGHQADKNVIVDNLIWKSSNYAIHLNHSDRNQIYRNRILETTNTAAIRLNNSSYNHINDNSIREGGNSGISILADAGGACISGGFNSSLKNQITNNQLSDFTSAISLGLGVSTSTSRVEGNALLGNRISNSGIGINSRNDTRNNYGRDNQFEGTSPNVVDNGTNNRY